MGVKGVGEADAIPVSPLFAQALEDALRDVDFEVLCFPKRVSNGYRVYGEQDVERPRYKACT